MIITSVVITPYELALLQPAQQSNYVTTFLKHFWENKCICATLWGLPCKASLHLKRLLYRGNKHYNERKHVVYKKSIVYYVPRAHRIEMAQKVNISVPLWKEAP